MSGTFQNIVDDIAVVVVDIPVCTGYHPVDHDVACGVQTGPAGSRLAVYGLAADNHHMVNADIAGASGFTGGQQALVPCTVYTVTVRRVHAFSNQVHIGVNVYVAAVDHDQAVIQVILAQCVAQDHAAVPGCQVQDRAVHDDVRLHVNVAFIYIDVGIGPDDILVIQILKQQIFGYDFQRVSRRTDGARAGGIDCYNTVGGQNVCRYVRVAVQQRTQLVLQLDGHVADRCAGRVAVCSDVGSAVHICEDVLHAFIRQIQPLRQIQFLRGHLRHQCNSTVRSDFGQCVARPGYRHRVIQQFFAIRFVNAVCDLQVFSAVVFYGFGNDFALVVLHRRNLLGRNRDPRTTIPVVVNSVQILGDHVRPHFTPDLLMLVDLNQRRGIRRGRSLLQVRRLDVGGSVGFTVVLGGKALCRVDIDRQACRAVRAPGQIQRIRNAVILGCFIGRHDPIRFRQRYRVQRDAGNLAGNGHCRRFAFIRIAEAQRQRAVGRVVDRQGFLFACPELAACRRCLSVRAGICHAVIIRCLAFHNLVLLQAGFDVLPSVRSIEHVFSAPDDQLFRCNGLGLLGQRGVRSLAVAVGGLRVIVDRAAVVCHAVPVALQNPNRHNGRLRLACAVLHDLVSVVIQHGRNHIKLIQRMLI